MGVCECGLYVRVSVDVWSEGMCEYGCVWSEDMCGEVCECV